MPSVKPKSAMPLNCLEVAMRFTHPIMPYITESIWQTRPIIDKKPLIQYRMTAAFPTADDSLISLQTEHDMTWFTSADWGDS